eukprot:4887250-Prymnesium_polylepis.1
MVLVALLDGALPLQTHYRRRGARWRVLPCCGRALYSDAILLVELGDGVLPIGTRGINSGVPVNRRFGATALHVKLCDDVMLWRSQQSTRQQAIAALRASLGAVKQCDGVRRAV